MDKASEVKTSLFSKQYTKTYVLCEKASEMFPARVGLSFELVPEKDITALEPGDTLVLVVYFNDAPYTGTGTWDATYNGFSTQAEDNFYPKTQIEGPNMKIPVPHAGRWFVRYAIKSDAQGEEAVDYTQTKHTATLVLQIPNPRKTPGTGGH